MEQFPAQRTNNLYLVLILSPKIDYSHFLLIKLVFLFSEDPPEDKEEKPGAEAERAAWRILVSSRVFLCPLHQDHCISSPSTRLLVQL